jgi:tetratricopeptide (TPR) repeat protein
MDRIDEFLKSLLNKTNEERDSLRKKEHTCPSEETIACYLDNLLKDAEREDLEGHLIKCDDCLRQIIMLHGLKKEVKENGYMAAPAVVTERAKNIVPESSTKSLIKVVFEYINNTLRAKKGYRLAPYGSIAMIALLSIGIYSMMFIKTPPMPVNPGDAEVHYNLGESYSISGMHKEAIEPYKQAIRINPDHAGAHYNLGESYSISGMHKEAIEPYKQVIRINPDHAEAHYGLGVAYSISGMHKEAIEPYKQVIRINPDHAEAHYGLGVAYHWSNDRDSAVEQHEILKSLGSEYESILANLIYR